MQRLYRYKKLLGFRAGSHDLFNCELEPSRAASSGSQPFHTELAFEHKHSSATPKFDEKGSVESTHKVPTCVLVLLDGWMVVRFVGVTRVPLCARVSCVRPVCVPAPPGVFLPTSLSQFIYRVSALAFWTTPLRIHSSKSAQRSFTPEVHTSTPYKKYQRVKRSRFALSAAAVRLLR